MSGGPTTSSTSSPMVLPPHYHTGPPRPPYWKQTSTVQLRWDYRGSWAPWDHLVDRTSWYIHAHLNFPPPRTGKGNRRTHTNPCLAFISIFSLDCFGLLKYGVWGSKKPRPELWLSKREENQQHSAEDFSASAEEPEVQHISCWGPPYAPTCHHCCMGH